MKKIAIAGLLMGMAGMGFAQSNVQIYGVVDLGITKGNGGTAANPGGNRTNDSAVIKNGSSSRLGFRGTEDLGNGWSAGFLLEHRFNADSGAKNPDAPFFMQSTVSLTSKDIGTFWMGRDYIPAFWVALKADPFGMDNAGQMGLGGLMADMNSSSEIQNRTNNSVGFKSKRWNGWSADVAYSMHEDGGKGAQNGFNVQYQNGALYAGLGFAKRSMPSENDGKNDELVNLAASYDFGSFRLMGYAAQGESHFHDNKTRVYSLGGDAKLGNGRLKLAYYDIDVDGGNDRKKLGIGYDYHLSKLTRVYADVGHAREKNQSSNTVFGVGIRKAF